MSFMTCCVPGCLVRFGEGLAMHCFPNPDKEEERFQKWVSKVGGEIVKLDMNFVFHNRRVCHKHFKAVYQYSKSRLSKLAVPSLYLSGDENHVAEETCESPINDDIEDYVTDYESLDEELLNEESRPHYKCDVCDKDITGKRYSCLQCSDYDMCTDCEAIGKHEMHFVLRIPNNKPQSEIVAVIEKLRAEFTSSNLMWSTGSNGGVRIKQEVEEKNDDPLTVVDMDALAVECELQMNENKQQRKELDQDKHDRDKSTASREFLMDALRKSQETNTEYVYTTTGIKLKKVPKPPISEFIQTGSVTTDTQDKSKSRKRTIQCSSVNNEFVKKLKSCNAVPNSDLDSERSYHKKGNYKIKDLTLKEVFTPVEEHTTLSPSLDYTFMYDQYETNIIHEVDSDENESSQTVHLIEASNNEISHNEIMLKQVVIPLQRLKESTFTIKQKF